MKKLCSVLEYFLFFDVMKNLSPSLFIGNFKTSYFGSICSLFLVILSVISVLIFGSISNNQIQNMSLLELTKDNTLFNIDNSISFALLIHKQTQYLQLQEIENLFSIQIYLEELDQQPYFGWEAKVLQKYDIILEKCSEDFIDKLQQMQYKTDNINKIANYMICPQINETLKKLSDSSNGLENIQGNLLRISIQQCVNCSKIPSDQINDYKIQLIFNQEDIKDLNQTISLQSSLQLWNSELSEEYPIKKDIIIDKLQLENRIKNILMNDSIEIKQKGYKIRRSNKRSQMMQKNSDLYFSQDIMLSGKEILYLNYQQSMIKIIFEIISKIGGFLILVLIICSVFYGLYAKHYLIQDIINKNYELPNRNIHEKSSRTFHTSPDIKEFSQICISTKENEFNSHRKYDQTVHINFFYYQWLVLKNKFSILFSIKSPQIKYFQEYLQIKEQIQNELNLEYFISSYYDTTKIKQIIFNSEQGDLFDHKLKIQVQAKKKRNMTESQIINVDSLYNDIKKNEQNLKNLNRTAANSTIQLQSNSLQFLKKGQNDDQSRFADWNDQFVQFITLKLYGEINKNIGPLINLIQVESHNKNQNENSPRKNTKSPKRNNIQQPLRSLRESINNFHSKNGFSSSTLFMNKQPQMNNQHERKEFTSNLVQSHNFQLPQKLDLQNMNSLDTHFNIDTNKQIQQYYNTQSPRFPQIKLNISKQNSMKPSTTELTEYKDSARGIQTQRDRKDISQVGESKILKNNGDLNNNDSREDSGEFQNDNELKPQHIQEMQYVQNQQKYINGNNLLNIHNMSMDKSSTSNVLVDFTAYQQYIMNDIIKQQEQIQEDQFLSKKRSCSFDINLISPLGKKYAQQRQCVQDDQHVDLVMSLNCISPKRKLSKKQTSPYKGSDEKLHYDMRSNETNKNTVIESEQHRKQVSPFMLDDPNKRSISFTKLENKTTQESRKDLSHLFGNSQNYSDQEITDKNKTTTKLKQTNQNIQSLSEIHESQINIDETTNKDQIGSKNQFVRSYIFSPSLILKSLAKGDKEQYQTNDHTQ